ncbi:ferrous iron transporter B [Serpentinicella alkaliphila]|uniref:Ferrous iron transport protein B n=1 Tax=Serpentinicella alkaliphila TaxID=1734049 RepID=A0A4R2TLW3_9FIRM|nr:ferrous iron transporter B [Serpentinicella alkaliphila]QUH24825.1 ferrous iron transporter B [Serpentinicella alkaliphila]TCQ03472.1 ferrous iron transport protein B [Serpentinicella alkaliphila]
MSCHSDEVKVHNEKGELNVLLMGNPNVGKSVIFSKLTGKEVLSSNYVGTTVTFMSGKISHNGKPGQIIDVPGTYSLEATSPAEEVAIKFLEEYDADVIICVLDATNLERNLNFALQLKTYGIRTIYSLNLIDVAERKGVYIDIEKLEKELGAPVIPTVAIRNVGLNELLSKAWEVSNSENEVEVEIVLDPDERWKKVGRIIQKVQNVEHRHPTAIEKLGDLCLKPFPGIPIAILVLITALAVVVGGGKGLRTLIFLPIVNNVIAPFFTSIVSRFVTEGIVFNVLVGEYGVLIKGFEWPFGLILPYVFLFYIVLSFLEDSGYLPRLGVLVDGVLTRLGIHGGNIVPFIMGYGCAVPAILGTRASTSKKERLIVASLVSLAVPCVAQTGAFISLLGDHSVWALIFVYMISFVAMVAAGLILNKLIPGKSDPMLLEIPNLLLPDRHSLLKKIWIRTKHFMTEAELPMLFGILFAAFVAETGVLNKLSVYIAPITTGWLGLPKEATVGLLLGVIRRELAVLPLLELNLTTLQLVVGSTVALFYIPCLSVLAVLFKEFGVKIAVIIGITTVVGAFLIGGLINHVGSLLSIIV